MEDLKNNSNSEEIDEKSIENQTTIDEEKITDNQTSKTPTTIKGRLFRLCKRVDILVQLGLLTALWIVVSVALGIWQSAATINVSKNLMLVMFIVSIIILALVTAMFILSLVLVIKDKKSRKAKNN